MGSDNDSDHSDISTHKSNQASGSSGPSGPSDGGEFFNKSGLSVLLVSVVAVLFIFVFVIFHNPGPIDDKWATVIAVGISHDEIVKRENEFRKSTPESIATGKALYAVNCSGCHSADPNHPNEDYVMARLENKQVKYGMKETDLLRVIYRGIPIWGDRLTQVMPRQDSISSPNRWALVNYMRSLSPGSPAANASDWKALDDEKIW